ncbi:hypothetical protein X975_18246, partial [Stegodyphus mimosarum]
FFIIKVLELWIFYCVIFIEKSVKIILILPVFFPVYVTETQVGT